MLNNDTHYNYDIVIVGAGIVGLSLACALTRSHLRIAILEAQPLDQLAARQQLRVSAINRASENWLREVGIWSLLSSQDKPAYQKVHVWDAATSADIAFDCHDLGELNLGYIVSHSALQQALLDKLQHFHQVRFLPNTQLTELGSDQGYAKVTLSNGQTITTRLVVGADGKHSKVRELADITIKQKDYGHHALVANIHTEQAHQHTARQVFLATGPLAFLPLADPHRCSIVWSADPATINELKQLSEEAFNQRLTQASEQCLGRLETVSQRASFPLQRQHARQYVKPGIVLLGDAAHTIHPLAGQGLNLGLADTACLAKTLLSALQQQKDFASLTNLRRYERERKEANLAMLAAMDGFKSLFGTQTGLVQTVRANGLELVNHFGWLKQQFAKKALGV